MTKSTLNRPLRWGLLAVGRIATRFAQGVQESTNGELVAVASREQSKAENFGDRFDIPHRYGSYEQLLADPDVDIVYISTPHTWHAIWAIHAANAGKHVLCEKPLTLNEAQAEAVVEAARRNNVFLMEAFMYRLHPQMRRLVELIQNGTLGEVQAVDVCFSFNSGAAGPPRLNDHYLGGGGILDVGCYCVSVARMVANAASGIDAVEPSQVVGLARIEPTERVDEIAMALLRFPGDVLAQLSCGFRLVQDNHIRVYGTKAQVCITRPPWVPDMRAPGLSELVVTPRSGQPKVVTVEATQSIFAAGADYVAEHLHELQAPELSWRETLANMRTLDRWREAIGLTYDAETEQGYVPLPRPKTSMDITPRIPQRGLGLLGRPVSQLVMGADAARTPTAVGVLWEHFFELGGNVFDTGWVYEAGKSEQRLGWWVEKHGVRDQVVLLDKGAHTPNPHAPLSLFSECTPEAVTRQHRESLERLRTDYVDVYMLHRDNMEVPVGEFIDVLNEHQRAGTMHAFGASNWTIDRIEQANDYARKHGLVGLSVVSNQLSLARMVHPLWAGAISAGEPEFRRWLEKHNMPLFPWSSQGRGFFVDYGSDSDDGHQRLDWSDRRAGDIARYWTSDDNVRRRARAQELAKLLGVAPVTIALAWVLHQPFAVFPIIGPRSIEELNTSIAATIVDLKPEQITWLDLATESVDLSMR